MIVVKNVFRLKYGQARPALALVRESKDMMTRLGITSHARFLTDLTGHAYTLVLENTYANLGEWEAEGHKIMGNADWQAWYHKFTPLVESGSREIYSVVE